MLQILDISNLIVKKQQQELENSIGIYIYVYFQQYTERINTMKEQVAEKLDSV